jgi:hypothetical protein
MLTMQSRVVPLQVIWSVAFLTAPVYTHVTTTSLNIVGIQEQLYIDDEWIDGTSPRYALTSNCLQLPLMEEDIFSMQLGCTHTLQLPLMEEDKRMCPALSLLWM